MMIEEPELYTVFGCQPVVDLSSDKADAFCSVHLESQNFVDWIRPL